MWNWTEKTQHVETLWNHALNPQTKSVLHMSSAKQQIRYDMGLNPSKNVFACFFFLQLFFLSSEGLHRLKPCCQLIDCFVSQPLIFSKPSFMKCLWRNSIIVAEYSNQPHPLDRSKLLNSASNNSFSIRKVIQKFSKVLVSFDPTMSQLRFFLSSANSLNDKIVGSLPCFGNFFDWNFKQVRERLFSPNVHTCFASKTEG